MKKNEVDIGKTIAAKIKGIPIRNEEPKKETARASRWVICPDFVVKLPETVSNEAAQTDHIFSVLAQAKTREDCRKILGQLLIWGSETIKADDKRIYLHAVKHSIRLQGNYYRAELEYTFRVYQIPEENL